MLIVKVKEGNSVYLGDDIVVHIDEVSGRVVKLAVVAPDDVRILRQKIYLENHPDERPIEPRHRY